VVRWLPARIVGHAAMLRPRPEALRTSTPPHRAHRVRAKTPLSLDEASAGMVVARVVVRAADVVYLKGILEASEGVAALFSEYGGELTLAAPHERRDELAELLTDLCHELGACIEPLVDATPTRTRGADDGL
jgi:hypothetical protein